MIKKIFGQHDEKTLIQLDDVASRAARVALMADGHLGYVMPIGGVAAYREKVSVGTSPPSPSWAWIATSWTGIHIGSVTARS
jgi:hypothetical protein